MESFLPWANGVPEQAKLGEFFQFLKIPIKRAGG
jgi:hypothetical protein